MEMFLELLSCGCCVDIQQYALYNIVSNAACLYKVILHCCCDVLLLFIMQVTTALSLHVSPVNCNFCYGNCHYVGRILLSCIFRKFDVGCGLGGGCQDRGRWRELVIAVLNLRVP